MKKLNSILLVIALVLNIFTGCSMLSDEPDYKTETTSVTEESVTDVSTTEESTTEETTTSTTTMFNDPDVEHTSKYNSAEEIAANGGSVSGKKVNKSSIPVYTGKTYVVVNNNAPTFSATDKKKTTAFEKYSNLDNLGRCGVAYACICREIMPTEPRGEIGMIKPSGWHTIRYDDIISDRYLYNRCHLIGYQLSGENANEKNLITGTRYMNVSGMLPFENMVADYVKETGNHVLYRSKPVFSGNELVARGVQLEAYSVEDSGYGICFNVFCFNIQPGIVINYADGSSQEGDTIAAATKSATTKAPSKSAGTTKAPTTKRTTTTQAPKISSEYIANKNTKKFHYSWCGSVKQMKESNKWYYNGSRDDLINQGYVPCKNCNP